MVYVDNSHLVGINAYQPVMAAVSFYSYHHSCLLHCIVIGEGVI